MYVWGKLFIRKNFSGKRNRVRGKGFRKKEKLPRRESFIVKREIEKYNALYVL
jgi:hypothetical protein